MADAKALRPRSAPDAGSDPDPGPHWRRVLGFGLAGNTVEPLIDGKAAFAAIQRAIESATGTDHYVYMLSWWLDPWVHLTQAGTSLLDLFERAGERGVQVRVLAWQVPRNYPNHARLHEAAVTAINKIPNCHAQLDVAAVLDPQLVGLARSHHQKLVVVKGTEGLVAVAGGVDVNPDRIHKLPPPPGAMRNGRPAVGWMGSTSASPDSGQPLHDVSVRLTGPTALPMLRIFLRRWWSRTGSRSIDARLPLRGGWCTPLPAPTGSQFVRIGETFDGVLRCPDGGTSADRRRTVQDIWVRSLLGARRFIYLEEQYLTNLCAAEAIRRVLPRLHHVTVLVPPAELADAPRIWALRQEFVKAATKDGYGAKLRIFTRTSDPPGRCHRTRGRHLYVHSKMAVIDDELLVVGSANCNYRGWETDTELVTASFEEARPGVLPLAARVRAALWAEHLGVQPAAVVDPLTSARLWDTASTRAVCRYDPTGGRDKPTRIPRGVVDPSERQPGDPCCSVLGACVRPATTQGPVIDVSSATRYIAVASPGQMTNDEWKRADRRFSPAPPVYNDYALLKVLYTLRLRNKNTRDRVIAFQVNKSVTPLDFSGLRDSDIIFIAGHGNERGLYAMGPDASTGVDRLVDILIADGNLKKHRTGKTITILLLSCRAGLGFHKSLARKLSQRLSIDTTVGGAQGFTFGSIRTAPTAYNEVLIRGIPWVMEYPGTYPGSLTGKEAENVTSGREGKTITLARKKREIEQFLNDKKQLEKQLRAAVQLLRSTEVNQALDEIDSRFRSHWLDLLRAQFELYASAKKKSNLEFDMWFDRITDGYLWADGRKPTARGADAQLTGTLVPGDVGLTCTR